MVEIVGLDPNDAVTLIPGATQHWKDPVAADGWEEVLARQAAGRTLVLGHVSQRLLERLVELVPEVHVLVRGIPDAVSMGNTVSGVRVWCGEPEALLSEVSGFDTVLCPVDASKILPLESPSQTWENVTQNVRKLGAADATVVYLVENDLGTHRIGGRRNPRSADQNGDWDPMRTWDESRPRSLAQLRQRFDGSSLICLWPEPSNVQLLLSETVGTALHTVLATHHAASPIHGPDPAWLIAGFGAAGSIADFAPAWLVVDSPRATPPEVERLHYGRLVTGPFAATAGRSALQVFAELAAAHDLDGIRSLITAWSSATAGTDGITTVEASFGLCLAESAGEGWQVTPLNSIPETDADEERWAALGRLVGTLRDRGWRVPWPSTSGYPRILNHLGIMAGLHTVSQGRAEQLIPATPAPDAYTRTDSQQLIAKIEQQEKSLHALRSKVAWLDYQLTRSLESEAVKPIVVARATTRKVARIWKRGAQSVKDRVGHLLG